MNWMDSDENGLFACQRLSDNVVEFFRYSGMDGVWQVRNEYFDAYLLG